MRKTELKPENTLHISRTRIGGRVQAIKEIINIQKAHTHTHKTNRVNQCGCVCLCEARENRIRQENDESNIYSTIIRLFLGPLAARGLRLRATAPIFKCKLVSLSASGLFDFTFVLARRELERQRAREREREQFTKPQLFTCKQAKASAEDTQYGKLYRCSAYNSNFKFGNASGALSAAAKLRRVSILAVSVCVCVVDYSVECTESSLPTPSPARLRCI